MPRVVVLGSSGFDLTIRLPRLPKPGETLLGGSLHRGPGGKGANSAIAAARAGADVTFLTAFGDDDFGREIREHDEHERLDLTYARIVPDAANQVALIFVGEDGQNLIGVAPGASGALGEPEILDLPSSVFDPAAVFLASLELPLPAVFAGLKRAQQSGMTTILNPAPADRRILDADILRHVNILSPNQEEAATLSSLPVETIDDAESAARILLKLGVRTVMVTLGDRGCLIVEREHSVHVPGFNVETIDTVGAGDAFNGVLALALAECLSLPEAARFANAAGALAVTKAGAQGALSTRDAIERLLNG
jgi:ribokinase